MTIYYKFVTKICIFDNFLLIFQAVTCGKQCTPARTPVPARGHRKARQKEPIRNQQAISAAANKPQCRSRYGVTGLTEEIRTMEFKNFNRGNRKQNTLRAVSLALGVLVLSSSVTTHAAELSGEEQASEEYSIVCVDDNAVSKNDNAGSEEATSVSEENITTSENSEESTTQLSNTTGKDDEALDNVPNTASDASSAEADDEFVGNGNPDEAIFQAKKISVVKKQGKRDFSEKKVASSKKLVSAKKASKKTSKKSNKQEAAPVEELPTHPYYSIQTTAGARTLSPELQDHTYNMCVKYGIPQYYGLILAQMWCESAYNPNVVSSARSYGLMQICSVNFARLQATLGLSNLHDPYQNIEAGVYMMAGYIAKYGDVQTALVCYHRGEGAARRGMRQDRYSAHIVSLAQGLSIA